LIVIIFFVARFIISAVIKLLEKEPFFMSIPKLLSPGAFQAFSSNQPPKQKPDPAGRIWKNIL